jgi:hypothetical protein
VSSRSGRHGRTQAPVELRRAADGSCSWNSREEQKGRLEERRKNPLRRWKVSPIDAEAVVHWPDYSRARNEMLAHAHNVLRPWTIVPAGSYELPAGIDSPLGGLEQDPIGPVMLRVTGIIRFAIVDGRLRDCHRLLGNR